MANPFERQPIVTAFLGYVMATSQSKDPDVFLQHAGHLLAEARVAMEAEEGAQPLPIWSDPQWVVFLAEEIQRFRRLITRAPRNLFNRENLRGQAYMAVSHLWADLDAQMRAAPERFAEISYNGVPERTDG